MRYSVNVPNFGEFAAPEVFADVARRAEEVGWDALLVWDHVVEEKHLRRQIADPWILLTAATLATRRIRLGTVGRRHPGNGRIRDGAPAGREGGPGTRDVPARLPGENGLADRPFARAP